MNTQKKVALVTGSTSGIGLACAHSFAKNGINVIMTGSRDETAVSAVLEDFKSGNNVQVDYIRADLRNKTDIESLWSEVTRLYPDGIDILVNNAAVTTPLSTECMPDDEWEKQVDVNLSAPFHLIKRCLPAMKNKGWGRIVNISSILGVVGLTRASGYISSKHGLLGLTKGVALENAAFGVTCNAVCPGYTDTPMLRHVFADDAKKLNLPVEAAMLQILEPRIPTGKLITPQQIAELVEFLCLSTASAQMTGASYIIDGGYTVQ